jgi:hypothetical protein
VQATTDVTGSVLDIWTMNQGSYIGERDTVAETLQIISVDDQIKVFLKKNFFLFIF